MSISRSLYSLIFYLAIPVVLLRLLFRAARAPSYALRWGERFGFVERQPRSLPLVWLHAVSVGESLAAVPVIRSLMSSYPELRIFVTCMTPTGSQRIKAAFGDEIGHSYAPYDLPDAVARFLQRVTPKLLIVMETELWPNTVAACNSRNIPVLIANARLSKQSADGYARISTLIRPMFSKLDRVAAQTNDDGLRYISLGSQASSVEVTGNIKFDMTLDSHARRQASLLREQWQGKDGRTIWLAASTHVGEDEIVLDAFSIIKKHMPETLLVLTPRHPERFQDVYSKSVKAGFDVRMCSQYKTFEPTVDILIGDTMGELLIYYGACDATFVGGSLVSVGGHNVIEPAAWGKPIISGPSVYNFSEVTDLLFKAGALEFCETSQEMAEKLIALFADRPLANRMGVSAVGIVETNRGALDKLLNLIDGLLN